MPCCSQGEKYMCEIGERKGEAGREGHIGDAPRTCSCCDKSHLVNQATICVYNLSVNDRNVTQLSQCPRCAPDSTLSR